MSAGGHAIWRFIHFKHNEHQIDDCKKLAKELGFARFDILYGGRTDSPVYNIKTGKYEYTIGIEMADIPKTALDHQLHKFNYRSPEKRIEFYKTVKVSESIDCLAKKQKEIYITATGDVYPCCYFGHYPTIPEYKQYWQMDNFAITPLIKNNNALEYGIEEAIKWFNSVEESWSKQSYLEGRLYKCDEFCGVNSVIDTKRHRL
jgi:MoaA/NifB/PqqE/SkfB family radical SAM enzyme